MGAVLWLEVCGGESPYPPSQSQGQSRQDSGPSFCVGRLWFFFKVSPLLGILSFGVLDLHKELNLHSHLVKVLGFVCLGTSEAH